MSETAESKPANQTVSPARAHLTRRRVLTAGAGLAGLAASATAVYAGAIEPQGLVVTRYAPRRPAGRRDKSFPSR